ncbi:hypothetical protein EVA25_01505 [bacterium]|nr:MAG: hypothetical protein EVA25_01505 [bacterium]
MVGRSEAENFLREFARWHRGVRLGYLFGRLALFANRRVFAHVVNGRLECRAKRRAQDSQFHWITLCTSGSASQLQAVTDLERSASLVVLQRENENIRSGIC